MSAPLSDITVLDLSRVLAGPWATQNLADLGARVIKIEHPDKGDDTRHWGPPFLKDGQGNATEESAYFLSANRGKESVGVDITTEEGQAFIKQLAAKADIVVENFKVGGLKKYGLDYDSLHALNPQLIYCSITGFGQDGPYAEKPGYDYMIQASGGLMSLTGQPDDEPGGMPMRVGVPIADLMTGMYATIAIQAALHARQTTGRGQHIDIALLDVQVAMLANQAMNYLVSGDVPGRIGNTHPTIVPYQVFHTEDDYIIIAIGNDQQFSRFCSMLGMADLADNPMYKTNRARVTNRKALISLLAPVIEDEPTAYWIEQLEAAGIPYGGINSLDQVFDHPQVKHRQLTMQLPHSHAGTAPSVRSPMRFSDTPITHTAAPPALGEHTEKVRKEFE